MIPPREKSQRKVNFITNVCDVYDLFSKKRSNKLIHKYGNNLVEELLNNGIQSQYLLSACRFIRETKIGILTLKEYYRKWNIYVAKYQNIDINSVTFNEFIMLTKEGERQYFLPKLLTTENGIIVVL